MEAEETQRRVAGYSTADELAKLGKLRDEGKITADEYEALKQKAMV
jgi:Short C-terminal domain